jgi:outer membrane murein-binding lipoprotein Lpp
MKHNLLRNFLALVLSGIMLAGVGCKNYDDDIDKINNRLDELYVTVADLDEQIESVRNAIPSLDALNEEVAALRSELDGVKTDVASIDQKLEAIGDVQAKLNELSQELKDYVNGAIQSSEETLRNELATKGAVSELEALIEGIQEDYKAELEEINNKLTALEGTVGELPAVDFSGDIQELKKRLAALEGSAADAEALADLTGRVEALEGINLTESDVNALIDTQIKELLDGKSWLGESLDDAIANYLETNEYITKEALNSYATYDETLAKLIDEMKTGQGKYVEELIAFIQANQTQIDANELQILVDGNQKKMSELMNEFSERLFALENRIQSLVYVPSSLTETSNLIPVTPAPYIDFGKDGKEYLGNQTLEMTFRVSPASLADKIVKEGTVSIITRKVSMSSTNSPAFTVESVTASEENEGEFTVKATTDYKFGSKNDETLAIALNVKIAGVTTGSEGEQTTHTGIDYTTSFLGLKYTGNGACINDALRIVKVDDEGKLVASLSNGLYSSSLKYNDYSVVNFLEGFDVYYFDGKKYMPLSEMWEGVQSSRSEFDKRATINPDNNEKSYKVTAESVQINEANLPTPDTNLIGDVITSSKVTFTVALGKKSLEIGEAQHKVTVVSNGVETSVPQTTIAWNHTKALNKSYTGNPVDMEPKVTVEHYKEMKPAYTYVMGSIEDFNKFALANQWASYIADNAGEIVDGAYVTLVMNSTPTAENDVQRITPTFYGMTFAEAGNYTAYVKYVHSDKTTTTITIPVTASGAPEISYEISKEVMYVGTSTYTVVENFAEALWNDNYKEAFGSKEAFLGVVAAMTATTGEDEATLSVAGNNINVSFPAEYEFKTYYSTLTLADKSGLEIVFPAEITLTEAHAMLTPNPLFVTNGRVNAIAEFNADGSRYDVVAQPLGNAYTYQVGEGEQALPGVKVVYEINKELQGDKLDEMAENGQTVPEIDADNKLIWNDWGALELKVDAYLVFTNSNEEVKGSRVTFTVAIDSPYADDKITVATKGNEFELSQDASFKVAQLLTLNSTYQSGEAGKETNTNVFDASTENGLHANLAKALGGEVKYETTFSNVNFAFDEETGVITYTGEDSSLKPVSQTIEVKVTYTNNFGVEFAPVTVQIKTK